MERIDNLFDLSQGLPFINGIKTQNKNERGGFKMFCFHCEQTAKGKGCDRAGVCGKTPEVAALQDLLIYSLIGLSQAALLAGN
jgi:hypothetical protein